MKISQKCVQKNVLGYITVGMHLWHNYLKWKLPQTTVCREKYRQSATVVCCAILLKQLKIRSL